MFARVLRAIVALFTETTQGWSRRNPDLLSAALAYNTIFSLAPLLLVIITIAGVRYRSQAIQQIVAEVDRLGGPALAGLVADLLAGMQRASSGPFVTIVSLGVLAWGASGMVLRLRFALNTMWDLVPLEAPNVRKSVLAILIGRLISMGIVLAIGFFLLALLVLNTLAVTLYSAHLEDLAPGLRGLAAPAAPWISSLLYCCVFALAFKLLPQGEIRWRDLWPGALLTTLLFWLGNIAIRTYIAMIFAASIHGVVASAIVLLLWVYYSALIVLFGARFTHVYTERYGTPITPGRNMQRR